jgi:hypothetical protein
MESLRINRPFRLSLSLIVLIACAVPAAAQEAVPGWDGLATSNLDTVHVLDDMGSETTGTLIGIDADSISLLVNGNERSFERARVRRLQKRGDSLKNGALIGAGVGVVLASITAAVADCPTASDTSGPGAKVGLAILGTAIYTGVGVGIDALVTGRTTMYEAPAGGAFNLPGLRPEIRNTAGPAVRLSFRW